MYDGLHRKIERGRARADNAGFQPENNRHTKDVILYEMRCGNGSQCNTSRIIILRYVVKLLKPANKSSCSPVDPPQLFHPNPRETSEDGTAIVKAAEHKNMNTEDNSIKGQRASNDLQLPQLIVRANIGVEMFFRQLKLSEYYM